jgi:hypothetical protein
VIDTTAKCRWIVIDDEVECPTDSFATAGVFIVDDDVIIGDFQRIAVICLRADNCDPNDLDSALGKAKRKSGIADSDVENALSRKGQGIEIVFDPELVRCGFHGSPIAPLGLVHHARVGRISAIEWKLWKSLLKLSKALFACHWSTLGRGSPAVQSLFVTVDISEHARLTCQENLASFDRCLPVVSPAADG